MHTDLSFRQCMAMIAAAAWTAGLVSVQVGSRLSCTSAAVSELLAQAAALSTCCGAPAGLSWWRLCNMMQIGFSCIECTAIILPGVLYLCAAAPKPRSPSATDGTRKMLWRTKPGCCRGFAAQLCSLVQRKFKQATYIYALSCKIPWVPTTYLDVFHGSSKSARIAQNRDEGLSALHACAASCVFENLKHIEFSTHGKASMQQEER